MAGNGAVLKEQEKLPKMPEVLQKKSGDRHRRGCGRSGKRREKSGLAAAFLRRMRLSLALGLDDDRVGSVVVRDDVERAGAGHLLVERLPLQAVELFFRKEL